MAGGAGMTRHRSSGGSLTRSWSTMKARAESHTASYSARSSSGDEACLCCSRWTRECQSGDPVSCSDSAAISAETRSYSSQPRRRSAPTSVSSSSPMRSLSL